MATGVALLDFFFFPLALVLMSWRPQKSLGDDPSLDATFLLGRPLACPFLQLLCLSPELILVAQPWIQQEDKEGHGTTCSLVTPMSHSKFPETITPLCVPPEAGTLPCLNHRWTPCSPVLWDDVFIWTVPDGSSRPLIHLLLHSRQAPQGFGSWGQHISAHLSRG